MKFFPAILSHLLQNRTHRAGALMGLLTIYSIIIHFLMAGRDSGCSKWPYPQTSWHCDAGKKPWSTRNRIPLLKPDDELVVIGNVEAERKFLERYPPRPEARERGLSIGLNPSRNPAKFRRS